MQKLNQSLSEATFLAQTGKMQSALTELLIAKGGRMKPSSWAEVQRMVRDGTAAKVFSIGDQLICQRNNVDLVWDVIGIDHDTPADPQFTHSMTLQLHDCFTANMQFDAPEALYYCETALAADDIYHFAVSGTDYQFTVPSGGIAAGSQLMLNFTGDTPASLSVSAAKGGTASGSITVTAGDGGTALVTNDSNRVLYGSDNYRESAIRQWLNSSAAAESVWTPQTDFDRPPRWHTGEGGTVKQDGFMHGMDADFLAVLGNVTKVTAKNTVTDGGGSDTTTEKFFLLSKSEIYSGTEGSGVDEGSPYPYYSDYSGLSEAGTGNDSNRIKYKNDTAQIWWIRTPRVQNSNEVYAVFASGAVYTNNANGSGRVSPACNII